MQSQPFTMRNKQSAEDAEATNTKTRKVNPLPEKKMRIAPIFLPKNQFIHGKGRSIVKQDDCVNKAQVSALAPSCEDVAQIRSQTKRKGIRRGQMSTTALHSCLEEIQSCNHAFPVREIFDSLQKKTNGRIRDFGDEAGKIPCQSSPQIHVKEKRKLENGSCGRVSKRLRSSLSAEAGPSPGHCNVPVKDSLESDVMTVKKQPRVNKLSRTHRMKRQSQSQSGLEKICEKNLAESDAGPLINSDHFQREACDEDRLWTDKYSPQHSSEVIGNSASVKKLQRWLKKWKLRADCDESRKMEERKKEENSNDSWDCGDFLGEAREKEETLGNTVLITGPPGVGKTAAVYACSQELGFKVFEVNCSSQRSGHHVLSQLKEATQSHLVETSGKDPLKPTYFNNYSSTPKSETLPGRKNIAFKKHLLCIKKKAAQSFGRSTRKVKANPATVTLSNYFKMKAKADFLHSGCLSPSEKPDGKKNENPTTNSDQTASENKKAATSLILFEEVDVIFDDDVGFLAAIKNFMTTTKRPVILTTNDPRFKERFNCSVEEIIFKAPTEADNSSYLQLVALAENMWLQLEDVQSLHRLSRGDVRRCLLQLQMWLLPKETNNSHFSSNVAERGNKADLQLPPCETSFIANMLGLYSVTPGKLRNLLKCQSWSKEDMNQILRILTESWRSGLPLLYTNLHLLLPVGDKESSVHCRDKVTYSGLQNEPAISEIHHYIQQRDGDVSQQEPITKSKSVRPFSRLSRRKCLPPVNDNTLLHFPQRSLSSSWRNHARTQACKSPPDKSEPNAAKLETNCLKTLTNFFDLMSYLDATLPSAMPLVTCKPETFVWTVAEIKDGLLDEVSQEEDRHTNLSQETLLDILTAVEALGCHRCCWQLSDAWDKSQKYRQELGDLRLERLVDGPSLASKTQSLSFHFHPLCAPSVSRRRFELSRKVLGSKSFSLLGNRRAVSVDYMPVLRYICRSQRAWKESEKSSRCLNYLNSIYLGLSKSTIKLLAEDF